MMSPIEDTDYPATDSTSGHYYNNSSPLRPNLDSEAVEYQCCPDSPSPTKLLLSPGGLLDSSTTAALFDTSTNTSQSCLVANGDHANVDSSHDTEISPTLSGLIPTNVYDTKVICEPKARKVPGAKILVSIPEAGRILIGDFFDNVSPSPSDEQYQELWLLLGTTPECKDFPEWWKSKIRRWFKQKHRHKKSLARKWNDAGRGIARGEACASASEIKTNPSQQPKQGPTSGLLKYGSP